MTCIMKELQPGRVRLVEDQELQTRQVKIYIKKSITHKAERELLKGTTHEA